MKRTALEYYRTSLGTAWLGDAKTLLAEQEDASVQLILTSPPFALNTKKNYGNPPADEYIEWFRVFAREFQRILREDGSLVIDIGGAWMPKSPTRSIYHFELLTDLVRNEGFFLAEEFYVFNRAKLPSPAQWVTVNRIRAKDAVNPVWWLSKAEWPKADNRRVLKPYSQSMLKLLEKGYNEGPRPSGHVVGKGFSIDHGGAIPPNLIEIANTRSQDDYQRYCREHNLEAHPARFAREVPEFFIKFLTDPGDLVLDPFGGSNMTGAVAEDLDRQWLVFEMMPEFLQGSLGRFSQSKLEIMVDFRTLSENYDASLVPDYSSEET